MPVEAEVKGKKRSRKKLSRRTKTGTKSLSGKEAEERYAQDFRKLLAAAEAHGVLRWILQGAGAGFREVQTQKEGPYGLPPTYLSRRRTLVATHVLSLLQGLDALTLGEIITDLLFELRSRGTEEGMKQAERAGLPTERDELASSAIMLVMRLVPSLFGELVKEGDESCATEFALCTTQFVETLEELARQNPEILREIASEMIAWPIMAARHYPKRSDFAELADRIGLASKSPVAPRERQTWKPHAALNRYLLDLIINRAWGDGRPLTKETLAYYLDEVLMPLFDKVAVEVGGWEKYPEFSTIARSAAKRGRRVSKEAKSAIASAGH